jgi:hypothetical protein
VPGATERTQAADRNASAPTAPARANRGAAAQNTSKELEPLKAPRTDASTPRAQPTETRQEETGRHAKAERSADKAAGEGVREPENPTEETPEKRAENITTN